MDNNFRFRHINDALARVAGGSVENCLGRTVEECVPDLWPELVPICRRVLTTGAAVVNREVTIRPERARDRRLSLLASYYPVRVNDDIVGVGMVVADVTEQIENEEARRNILKSAIAAIAATIEARDPYTAGHEKRVAEMAQTIANEMGLSAHDVEGIGLAATIHDIGKIGVPAEILSRPGKLSPAEFALVKGHSRAGHDIVAGIDFPWPIARMILQHHERFDGTGYPDGAYGEQLNIGSRIIAVADVVEAMASHRPYRAALGIEPALEEIREGRDKRFDPDVVDVCLQLFVEGRLLVEHE